MDNDLSRGRIAPKEINGLRLRVLVVEDDPAVRKCLAKWLRERQFSVLTAADLRSASDAARRHWPDVILLDVRLGAEDGLQLLKILQDDNLAIPCVVLTGHAGARDGFAARDLGAVELLEKPVPPDEIADALQRAVQRTRSGVSVPTANPSSLSPRLIPIDGNVRARISAMIVRAVLSEVDLPTTVKWGKHSGVAEGTLKGWCTAAHVSAKKVLLFARILRALHIQRTTGKAMLESLEIVDRRTIRKILPVACIAPADGGVSLISAQQFIVNQRLLTDETILAGASRLLLDANPETFG